MNLHKMSVSFRNIGFRKFLTASAMNYAFKTPVLHQGAAVSLLGVAAAVSFAAQGQSRPLHFLTELFCVVIACSCCLLLQRLTQGAEGERLFFYGLGLGLVGLADSLHLLFSPEFGAAEGANAWLATATQDWSRFLMAGILVVGPWVIKRDLTLGTSKLTLLAVGSLGMVAIFAFAPSFEPLPTANGYWPQLALWLGFALAGATHFHLRTALPRQMQAPMLGAILLFLASLTFGLLRLPENLGQLFQLAAYYFIGKALLDYVSTQAETDKSQSERRLETILAMMPDLVIVVDAEGYYRDFLGSPNLLLGPAEKALNQHYRNFLPPELARHYEIDLERARSTGQAVIVERKLPLPLGLRDVEIRVQAGKEVNLLLLRDITERKAAEKALVASQARLSSVLRMMPDLVIVVDDQGYYRDFLGNTELQTVEQINRHYREVLPEAIYTQFETHLKEAQATGKTVFNEFQMPVHGKLRYLEARLQVGDEGLVLVLLRDITERKAAEQALAETQQRLSSIVHMLPDMIFLLDDQGEYKSVLGNLDYLVAPPDVLLGKTAKELLPPALAQQVMDNIKAVLTTGHPVEFEYELQINEQPAFFEGRMVKLSEQATMSLVRNITTRKQAERSILEAKLAAERASLAKSNFLATMNHELRTPMNGVMGMAQLLTETPLTPLQREFVDTILVSGEALVALLTDIMELTRLETNRLHFMPVETDLGQVLEMLVRLFQSSANAKGLELHINLGEAVQPWVQTDATMLKQVLSNLVANSIKFTAQGSVQVTTELVYSVKGSQKVRFQVRDTGIGIAPNQQTLIFDAFYQVDNSSTRLHGGSGLGLSIVAKAVRAMGGDIQVESTLGAGSCFWFELTLPLVEVVATLPKADSTLQLSRVPSAKRPHVLIVEDDPNNRLVAEHFLSRINLTYACAENGKAALEAALRQDFDLILMDCLMPVMDGYEATRQLRQMARFAQVPIVALTAKTGEADRQSCLDAGMDEFLTKPVRFDLLKETILRCLGKRSLQR